MGRYYRNLKKKPKVVKDESQLPPGTWVTVYEAGERKNYHPTSIRMKFFRGEVEGRRVGDGPLLVRLEEVR